MKIEVVPIAGTLEDLVRDRHQPVAAVPDRAIDLAGYEAPVAENGHEDGIAGPPAALDVRLDEVSQ